MSNSEQANVDLITANKVRDLLNRNGIPPRSHNTTIANVLGLSFSVVTRKMKGLIPWNLSQLQDIATHFGVPPAILLDDKGTQPAAAEMIDATLVIESRRFRCRAAISTKASPERDGFRRAAVAGRMADHRASARTRGPHVSGRRHRTALGPAERMRRASPWSTIRRMSPKRYVNISSKKA